MDSKPAHEKACRSTFDVDTVAEEAASAKRDPNVTDFIQQRLKTCSVLLTFDVSPLIGVKSYCHGEAAWREDRGSGIRPEAATGGVKIVVGALQEGTDGSGR